MEFFFGIIWYAVLIVIGLVAMKSSFKPWYENESVREKPLDKYRVGLLRKRSMSSDAIDNWRMARRRYLAAKIMRERAAAWKTSKDRPYRTMWQQFNNIYPPYKPRRGLGH